MDGTATILIVDDNEANRYTTRLMLERAGFGVCEAETGHRGLELAEQGPDLMIVDLHLPDIPGVEICRRLKASARTSVIPVLHVTAMYPGSAEKAEALAAGADGYLTRPLDSDQLLATIKTVLTRRAA
jgi:sigma-B regulation protein RsbU (phosphoserine phosphatase)